jgi:hypothetical protein
MALADQAKTKPVRTAGPPCSVGTLLDQLDAKERKALETMLGDPAWSSFRIFQAVSAEGLHVASTMIGRHRVRDCKCFR